MKAGACGLALLTLVAGGGCSSPMGGAARAYSGDGIFRDISYRSPLVTSPGFELSFPKFALDREYVAEYRLGALPVLDTDMAQSNPNTTHILIGVDFGSRQELNAMDKAQLARVAEGSSSEKIRWGYRAQIAWLETNRNTAPTWAATLTLTLFDRNRRAVWSTRDRIDSMPMLLPGFGPRTWGWLGVTQRAWETQQRPWEIPPDIGAGATLRIEYAPDKDRPQVARLAQVTIRAGGLK